MLLENAPIDRSVRGVKQGWSQAWRFLLIAAVALPGFTSAGSAAETPLSGDAVPTADGPLIIHPINHATLALGWKQKTIYVDPVGSTETFAALPKPDLILVTDLHGDHFNKDLLAKLAPPPASLVVSLAVAEQLPADLKARAVVLANGQSNQILGIPIEAIAAYNTTPARASYHAKGRGNGYLLTLGGLRVYLSGDTEDIPEMRALRNISVAFLCMNLPYTMEVTQAAKAVRAFRPKIVYPYHCRGSNLEEFKKLVGEDVGVEVRLRNWYPPKP